MTRSRPGTVLMCAAIVAACAAPPRSIRIPDAPVVVTSTARARIDSTLARFVDEGAVAGVSALVWEKGREAYFNAFGMADREAGRPMRRDAIVQIFSMTKPVTGVALMTLWEDGKFELDQPLSTYLPEFADARVFDGVDASGRPVLVAPDRPITIRDITRHTAGFATGGDDPVLDSILRAAAPGDRDNTLAELTARLAAVPLAFHPGSKWRYGPSVDVQARLVEVLSGQSFQSYVREHVLDPLSMRETRYFVPGSDRGRVAAIYDRSDAGVLSRQPDARALAFNTARWPLTPGGWGLTSTIDDYMRFARMLLNGGELDGVRILEPETVARMSTSHLDDSVTDRSWLPSKGSVGFGIDFAVRTRSPRDAAENNGEVGEFFWDGAASTLFWVDPVNELAAVLFVQLMPFDRVGLHKGFRDAVYGPAFPGEIAGGGTDGQEDGVPMQTALGIFDDEADVGRVSSAGSTRYDPALQRYEIAGSGQNMWGARDDFHYVWKRMTGDFILRTRVRFVGTGVDPHRKAGWTIRPSLETDAPHVTAAAHGSGLMSLQFRRAAGAETEEIVSPDSLADVDAVVQLERRGSEYLMSVARFGDTLTTTRLDDVSLPDDVYVGLYVCAHNDTVPERALFSNVRITVPTGPDFQPYQDYLGSRLEILDIESGNATVVHEYGGSFQAPNWTPDGRSLIYAQEGRLLSFDIASGRVDTIDTGFATRNNNDHVLSFDGRMLGISHHSEDDDGASIIYTLPATGGTPRRATANGPSYLHGWSPDGQWLVYTGQRDGVFDIYRVPWDGGAEVRLTDADGLDDGPEYTPDGEWIWFNSERSGRMQLWRMRPDGSEQTQMTDDAFNNWFPHISPDGRQVAYIAFPADIDPGDHPFYKHVTLRLMPVEGGPARVIAYLYGGQGTINVPSWSPDSRRIAFVSNTAMGESP